MEFAKPGEDGDTTGEDGDTTGGDDDVTTGGDDNTTGEVVPDSIGEDAEGVTEGVFWGAVDRGGLGGFEETTTGVLLLCAGELEA